MWLLLLQVFSLQGEMDEQNQAEPPHKIVINNKQVLSTKYNKAKWKGALLPSSSNNLQTTKVWWLDHKGKLHLSYLKAEKLPTNSKMSVFQGGLQNGKLKLLDFNGKFMNTRTTIKLTSFIK